MQYIIRTIRTNKRVIRKRERKNKESVPTWELVKRILNKRIKDNGEKNKQQAPKMKNGKLR